YARSARRQPRHRQKYQAPPCDCCRRRHVAQRSSELPPNRRRPHPSRLEVSDDRQLRRLLRVCRKRPRRRCAAEQGNELAPSHELPSEEVRNLSHHWTMRALCIAAKYSAYVGSGVKSRPSTALMHVASVSPTQLL